MKLSQHFTLDELTVTGTGLPNVPNAWELENLKITAGCMELVRTLCGDRPVVVSSGFRCEAVNKAVGGVDTSAHRFGYAVDFTIPPLTPTQICTILRRTELPYDQLIDETRGAKRWVHISFDPKRRREYLSYINGRYVRHS